MKIRLRNKPILVWTALFLLAVALFLAFGEHFLWLNTNRINNRTDAVIALAGSLPEDRLRIKAAIDLFHRQKAKYFILPMRNRYFTWAWAVKTYDLVGTPPEDRILIGRFGKSKEGALKRYGGTFVEAQYAAQLMHDHQLRSAVVVSSGYHMRRAALAFDKTGKAASLTYTYHPVGSPDWTWWLDEHRFRVVLHEYRKMIAALILYPFADTSK